MKLTPYLCRFIPEKHKYEIVNMYHTARIALSGTDKGTKYDRKLWAAKEFHKLHPEVSETAAYKDLNGLLSFGEIEQ